MRLGQLSPHLLGVIARTSSMAYKRTDKSVTQIGQELGVEYVLEGSVRREADQVRVTAQLIRVRDQIHLWAENYDRQLPGVLDIQGEIGAAIAAQVAVTSEGEFKRGEAGQLDPEALDHYLRGRYHYARSNLFDLQKAVGYFQKATERDPDYALAYSGWADALVILPISGDIAPQEVFPLAKRAIARALELDPHSAEAHTADATSKFWFDWDFPGAETAARRAIELNENYSLAHLYLAHVLSNTGRHEEAMATMRQVSVLDPLSLIRGAMRGQFLYHARRDAEAVEQFKATLSMESRFWVGQICFAKVLERLGRYEEALAACNSAFEFSGGNSEALSLAGYVHAITGNRAKAEENIHKMMDRKKERYVPSYNLALVFAGLQETEPALDWLENALEEKDVHMTFLRDYKWDGMRAHPKFQQVLVRAGFATS
jgi:tetratricopeptide (TPR) repeat protein